MKSALKSKSPFRIFGISAIVSGIALTILAVLKGPGALLVTLVLVAIELAFSFDNAIINAKILRELSPFWQKLFLTLGVVIAIFGMRVLFPLIIVMITAHMPLESVINLGIYYPDTYAQILELAHPAISAFGGSFLLMLSLHFFMDDQKGVDWIRRIEKPLKHIARWWVPALVTIIIMLIFAVLPDNHHLVETIQAGIAGIVLYLAINLFTEWLGGITSKDTAGRKQTGIVAFLTFMYLQILDASFSFDGVIGAFAISNQVVLIAVGLGIGAIWVRSMTVYMVQRGTLDSYRFLEHGAHYAVLALAIAMLLGLIIDVPQIITGMAGLGIIGASIGASRSANKSAAH